MAQMQHAPYEAGTVQRCTTQFTVSLAYRGTMVTVAITGGTLDDVERIIQDAHTRAGWSIGPSERSIPQPVHSKQPRTASAPPALTLLPQLSAQPRLALADWLQRVNERPNEAPHISIFGPSGSGKTTLAHAILATRRGQFVIVDPKPVLPGAEKWCGIPYVMIDDDGTYTAIETQLAMIRAEVSRRLAAMKRGEPAYTPLTVVLDEYKTLRRVCPELAPDVYITLSDIGRELGMRLIVLSTSSGAEALGLKGMADTKQSHVIINVTKQHRATFDWDEQRYELETPNPAVVLPAIPPAAWWTSPTRATIVEDHDGVPEADAHNAV